MRLSPTYLAAFVGIANFLIFTVPAVAQSDLVAAGAEVQKLAGDFQFTEGPAVDAEGNIFFSDIPNDKIHKWSVDGELSTFRDRSRGANGLYFDREGNLIVCEGGSRRLTSISPTGRRTTLVDAYFGKQLNSPNDVWVRPDGGIYFTDPRYGDMEGLEQDGFHVYYLSPKRAGLIRVTRDLTKPNGVVGTADGKKLYIADAGAGKTYVYNIQEDGTLADKQLFVSQGSDGMTLDERGNLYLTGAGVDVFNPDGEKIGTIEVPERPANVCFGGKDRKTLFITARTSLYSIAMAVRGQ